MDNTTKTTTETTTETTTVDDRFVCGEILYASGDYGQDCCDVHSDICPPGHVNGGLSDSEYRAFAHQCLDEWLNKSNGTGYFVIGDPDAWQLIGGDNGDDE